MLWFIFVLCTIIAIIFGFRRKTSKWTFEQRKWVYADFPDNFLLFMFFSMILGVVLGIISAFINDSSNFENSVLFWISIILIFWPLAGMVGFLGVAFVIPPLAMFLIWFFEFLFLYCLNLEKDDLDPRYHWNLL